MKMTELAIEVPALPPRELSPHRGIGDFRREAVKRAYRDEWYAWGYYLALEQLRGQAPPGWERAEVTLTLYARDKRNIWDTDNLIAALDPLVDGLVQAGVLKTDKYVSFQKPQWVLGQAPRTVIAVKEG